MNDGLASYNLAIACQRENAVRRGQVPPTTERERRWAEEGPRESRELESVWEGAR